MSEPTPEAAPACEHCGTDANWAPPVTVIIVRLPGLPLRYPLEPEWGTLYRPCLRCKSLWRTVDNAVRSNAVTAEAAARAGPWTDALIVCQDHLLMLHNPASDPARPASA